MLIHKWARGALENLAWSKCKCTAGKVDPSPQFLAKEKFTFQRNISAFVSEHDISPSLGTKNTPIKGADDKFAVSCTGEFLPIHLIYAGKTEQSLPKHSFSTFFFGYVHRKSLVTHREICWIFKEIVFPYLEDTKQTKSYPLEQHALIIIDTFKRQDNDTLKKLCAENNCEVVIVPHNFTNKSKPLDLSVNKTSKSFIKYNDWFADQVFTLQNGKYPTDVKTSSKLSNLKPIHARWIVDWYNHVIKEKEMIARGFKSAVILETVQNTDDIHEKIENPFRE